MEVKIMNCGEIKNLIIEYDGKLESAKLKPEIMAEVKSHLASCKKCALAKERMVEMTAKIAADRVEVPANLAADIISRVIPASEQQQARPKIVTFTCPEPGFMEKLAAIFGLSQRNFAFVASAIFIAVIAAGVLLYGYGLKYGDESGKMADGKNMNIEESVIKDPVEKKFKKAESGSPKNVVFKENEVEKKFKKSIFTVESGSVAGFSGEYKTGELYQVKQGEDLSINYKKVAQILIKTNSKFKINDEGVILESGMVSVDLKPKSLAGFKVVTPEAVVEVVGTVFTVASSDGRTEVSVKKGCVKVTDLKTKGVHTLNAGDSKAISAVSGPVDTAATAPVLMEYGAGKAASFSPGVQSTSETAHVPEAETAPVEVKGANIKQVIDSFKNEKSE